LICKRALRARQPPARAELPVLAFRPHRFWEARNMDVKKIANADFLYGTAMLGFCTLWIYLGLEFPAGTQDGVPGCGTFPILVSIVLGLLSFWLMIRSFINPMIFFNFLKLPPANKAALFLTFAILIAYLVIWYYVNYISSTLFMTIALGLLYRIHWKTNIIVSLLFTFCTYYVFGKFLLIILELH
jgi:hypothetical protein